MLQVTGLRFTYDNAPLLQGVDLQVEHGQSVFLLGPSGAGKSTILRCIAGLESPEEGSISLDGVDLAGVAPHRRGVGLMMQDPSLFPHLTAAQNVSFGMRYHGVPRAEQPSAARKYLAMVDLAHKADALPDQLSGGQQQRIALARTLAAKPRAVLLDEPLTNLDRSLRDELGLRTRDLLQAEGIAALWVTHDEGEAKRLGHRVLRLVDGALVSEPNVP